MLNFRLENSRNKGGKRLVASPYFFVLAAVFSVTFGLLFLDNFRAYRSDISVLIIPKSESASFQIDQIMENLTDITHRLSFYDRVLFDNPEIHDPFAGLGKDERKENWNNSFAIERLSGSTTLNLSVFNADKTEANKIARQTALSLSQVASRFYNIQTELEFRIIEGPLSSPFIRSWAWLVALSLLCGTVASFLLLAVFNLPSGAIKHKLRKTIIRRDYFSPPSQKMSESVKNDFAAATMKKASAPSNLPIAEEEIPNAVHQPTSEVIASVLEKEEGSKGEPTDEEYRERLNKLLRGEI